MTMEGYAQVAWRMSAYKETAIVRGFAALNAQNLLYMQAELSHLEDQLKKKEEESCCSGDDRRRWYARDWHTLRNANDADGGDKSQWRLFLDIREKLKGYNEALSQQILISQLHKPREQGLDLLRYCLKASPSDRLLGNDGRTWEDKTLQEDLVALNPVFEFDPFTRWLVKTFLGVFHKLVGHRYKAGPDSDPYAVHYQEEHMMMATSILSTVLSSLLPVMSIVVLYLVESMAKRLGLLAIFTAVFSFTLAIMTNAKRPEIFAATAAFAAVQVVFIGTNGSGASRSAG